MCGGFLSFTQVLVHLLDGPWLGSLSPFGVLPGPRCVDIVTTVFGSFLAFLLTDNLVVSVLFTLSAHSEMVLALHPKDFLQSNKRWSHRPFGPFLLEDLPFLETCGLPTARMPGQFLLGRRPPVMKANPFTNIGYLGGHCCCGVVYLFECHVLGHVPVGQSTAYSYLLMCSPEMSANNVLQLCHVSHCLGKPLG